jgi:hypothetical protein
MIIFVSNLMLMAEIIISESSQRLKLSFYCAESADLLMNMKRHINTSANISLCVLVHNAHRLGATPSNGGFKTVVTR